MDRGGWFRILFGAIILLIGIIGLGNEMKWWNISLPIWPAILILIGAALFLGGIERKFLG